MNAYDKRPRHYAAEIIALADIEQRRAALAHVPEHWRALTKAHVSDYFNKKRFKHQPKEKS